MQLGYQFGYWTAAPRPAADLVAAAQRAEALGYDSLWTGESWSSDAFAPLAAVAGATSTIRLCTGIAQIGARPPTTAAMHAITLDGLSGGRAVLGLGVGGPQVAEGWYGRPFAKPLARTREYVDVVRRAVAREAPVANDGPHYPLPYTGEGSVGLGKPLKLITHPLRPRIPILLGAEGPKNVALAFEIADGWLPLYFPPEQAGLYDLPEVPDGFEIAVNVSVFVDDDVATALWPVKATLGFYIGGMGAKGRNFHTELMARMGHEEAAFRIQELFLDGKRDEAIAAVPDEWVDLKSLVGPPARIKERYRAWEDSGADSISVRSRQPEAIEVMAQAARLN